MATSPYTDPILDYLADGQPHTIAEIRVAIMAPEGAGIDQLLRGMMWELAVKRDPRKLTSEKVGHSRIYQIVSRDPANPFIPELREEISKIPLAPADIETQEAVAGRAYRHEKEVTERTFDSPICRSDPGRPDGWNQAFLHSMNGWLKLHRKIQEWEWYDDANTFRVFFHCLVSANWRPKVWRGLEIEAGSFFSSYDKIGESLRLSKQQVRTAMDKLKTTGEVTLKATHNGLLITVSKYATYNEMEDGEQHADNTPSNTPVTREQHPIQHFDNTLVTPTEEGEEREESKEGKKPTARKRARVELTEQQEAEFEEFWRAYPKRTGRGTAEESWQRMRPPLADILAALEWQRKEENWTKDRGQFIPMPSTYLNQKRWLDEPTKPVSAGIREF